MALKMVTLNTVPAANMGSATAARHGAPASWAAIPAGVYRPHVTMNANSDASCATLSASDTPENHSTASMRSSAAVRFVDAGWMMTHLATSVRDAGAALAHNAPHAARAARQLVRPCAS